ncbi:MAG: long-chain-acyl-CoA synthetase [Xanthobacteraceae bacterium]
MALVEMDRTARIGRGTQSGLRDWMRALEAVARIAGNPNRTLLDVIEDFAQSRGDAEALISERDTLTYRALVEKSRRYARWALAQGLAKGQTVCLLMPNRPEYIAIWLGVTSVGGVVSLINAQLRGPSLAHCIDIVAPAHVIVAAELTGQFRSASLSSRPKIWAYGGDEYSRIDREIERFSDGPLTHSERRAVTIADRALTIYTSGTTGLPKAANVSHRRLLQWSFWFAGLMDTRPDDRMYDCLPMYHSIGGVVAIGALLVRGGSVVIREKFSATEFWDDIAKWDCTLFQYIGELCRYLVNAPPHPRERAHRLRLCCGNGLRADIWPDFKARFEIPRILEYYAATEGNVSLYNVEGEVGAIGRVPPFLTHRFPLALVKFDAVSGEPVRGADGHCIRATNETGEAIGRIKGDAAQPGGEFEGYTDAAATGRKILRDVFAPGDAWYRTGDVMRMDAAGFYYFVDRIGDTFRWKGENVATSEVAAAILAFPGIADASVYGVAVPGTEGAAGMATLVSDGALDFAELRQHLAKRLPPYARPLFLRIKDSIETTATFKHKKPELARQGFDLATVADPIYFDDPERQAYVRLDQALCQRIGAGTIRI